MGKDYLKHQLLKQKHYAQSAKQQFCVCIMLFSKTTVTRQWQRKLHPKSEFTLFETASSLLFQELNSKGLYLSSRKENESRCLVFPSCIKREKKDLHSGGSLGCRLRDAVAFKNSLEVLIIDYRLSVYLLLTDGMEQRYLYTKPFETRDN